MGDRYIQSPSAPSPWFIREIDFYPEHYATVNCAKCGKSHLQLKPEHKSVPAVGLNALTYFNRFMLWLG